MAKKLGKEMSRTVCVANETPVANQDEVYTSFVIVENNENQSIWLQAEGTAVHLRVSKCVNHNLSGEYPPRVSEWSEKDLDGHAMIVAEDFSAEELRVGSEQPPYAVYERFKVTGLAGNGADTRLTVIVVMGRRAKPTGY